MESNFEVAIIGAGVSGLCLALSLQCHNIKCTVYEKQSEGVSQGGSVILFPNSLRVLDSLGVYDTIHKLGFDMTTTAVKDASFKTIRKIQISKSERYGYAALRIRRDALVGSLLSSARKQGISVNFEHRLIGILESGPGAECRFSNGVTRSASLVVGADGLRSKVREICFLDAPDPAYTGQAMIMWPIPCSLLPDWEQQTAQERESEGITMATPQGAVLIVANSSGDPDTRIWAQRALPERDVAGWKQLGANKKTLLEALRNTTETTPDLVRSALEHAEKSEGNPFFLWPFYIISVRDGWISKGGKGRVLLLGDAAHAFPPVGGQGAGMAIEDADGLGLALSDAKLSSNIQERLSIWLKWRMSRVGRVADYTANLGKSRVAPPPPPASAEIRKETKPANPLGDIDDLAWLYDWRSSPQLTAWIEEEEKET